MGNSAFTPNLSPLSALSPAMQQALDNPIWTALTTEQTHLGHCTPLAARFHDDIGPLTGLPTQSAAAYAELKRLLAPTEQAVLFLSEPHWQPDGLRLDFVAQLVQMVYTGNAAQSASSRPSPKTDFDFDILPLGEADVPDMLALTHLTQPGPFRKHTRQLGAYFGIRAANGQLAAMAGERLSTPYFTEVSAVCTHPEHQGKGYAQVLMQTVTAHILAAGKTPILHSRGDNEPAIHVYQKRGFQIRRPLEVAVFSHSDAPIKNPGQPPPGLKLPEPPQ